MKKHLLFTMVIFPFFSYSQVTEWKYPCHEEENKQNTNVSPPPYILKKFPKKVSVIIEVKKYKYGSESYTTDFRFVGKIKNETDVLPINDSLGIKISLARAERNGQKKYLYILALYTKKKDDCWRSMSVYSTYSEVWAKEMQLTGGGVGYPGDKTYFSFVDGVIKLD